MPFLGIISWKVTSRFNGREGCFSDGGCPMGGISFVGGLRKTSFNGERGMGRWGHPHYGKPWLLQLRRFSGEEQALCSASESFNYINGGRFYIFEMIYILSNVGFLNITV